MALLCISSLSSAWATTPSAATMTMDVEPEQVQLSQEPGIAARIDGVPVETSVMNVIVARPTDAGLDFDMRSHMRRTDLPSGVHLAGKKNGRVVFNAEELDVRGVDPAGLRGTDALTFVDDRRIAAAGPAGAVEEEANWFERNWPAVVITATTVVVAAVMLTEATDAQAENGGNGTTPP